MGKSIKSSCKSKKNKAYSTEQRQSQALSQERQKVVTFECNFVDNMMEWDDMLEKGVEQNDPEVLWLIIGKWRAFLDIAK